MSIEAMKQALEFIKATNKSSSFWLVPESNLNKTVHALTVAIEQAEKQEPVAWRYRGNLHEFDPSDWATEPVTPLYTAPPQRQPLTEEEYLKALEPLQGEFVCSSATLRRIVRAIERKHGIGGGE